VQTDATRTCELLVGLRDVTVLGVDERLRQPLEVCVDPQHPGSHRSIAIPEGSGARSTPSHQSGACPRSVVTRVIHGPWTEDHRTTLRWPVDVLDEPLEQLDRGA